MEVICKAQTKMENIVNLEKNAINDCEDSGHCKYCIRGTDYSN